MNIAHTLTLTAARVPFQRGVVFPAGRDRAGRVTYSHLTFLQLDRESDRLARGLLRMGIRPGERLVLMVKPSLEFIALTFALFKAGAVVVLIDPGMGLSHVLRCLDQVEPDGFVAIPAVHAARVLQGRRFSRAKHIVTVGRRWGWGGETYASLLGEPWAPVQLPPRSPRDSAAIIFTSGSTGPAKGVLYEHGMFAAQVEMLRDFYRIEPGEIDLPGFPLFALFNAAMGVTTVIPEMDPTRPARVDPRRIVEAIDNQGVTQAFGSPAIWNRVSRHCEAERITFPSLKRILSAGAPVPEQVLSRMLAALPAEADIHTPYGATEALPVSSISARQVLAETAALTRTGSGTCVGRPFPGVDVRIITITREPISDWSAVRECSPGTIGEITVRSPAVTREYFRHPEGTRLAKIPDGDRFWHRMGDVGYFDADGRLWFCGRKAHIVETSHGPLFTDCCEPVFNTHPRVYRSALVGVGEPGAQRPVIVVEPEPGEFPRTPSAVATFVGELREIAQRHPTTASLDTYLFHPALPVDVRHNVKISREQLAPWARDRV